MRALSNEFVSQNVIFLEYREAEYAEGQELPYRSKRLNRFMDAWSLQRDPEDDSPHTPLLMVDSGRWISFGFSDYRADYRRMVSAALDRPAEMAIHARKTRPVGGSFVVDAQVTNLTHRTISADENEATLHVFIFEGRRIRDIEWEVDRMASRHVPIETPLYPGETQHFQVKMDGFRRELYPSRVEAIVFVDALSSMEPRRWDMLQAAVAGSEGFPPVPPVVPTATPTTAPPTASSVPTVLPTSSPIIISLPVLLRAGDGFPIQTSVPPATTEPSPTATPDDIIGAANIRQIEVKWDKPDQGVVERVATHGDLVAWAAGGSVRLHDLASGRQLHHSERHQRNVHAVAFSADGRTLYSGGADPAGGRIRAMSLPDHEELWSQAIVDEPWGVSFSVGGLGRYLVTDAALNVRVWRLTPEGMTVRGNLGAGQGPVFAPADKLVAFWKDGVQLSTKDGDAIRHLPASSTTGFGGAIAFSPDGLRVAGGAQDGVVHVWQVSDGATVWALSGHTGSISALRFSADGGLLLSASADHTIRAWDTSDGTALHVIEAHAGAVTAMTLSNDGRWLLSGSQDGHVRLWGLGLR